MVNKSEIVAGSLCGFLGILVGSFWLSGSADWITKLLASIGALATAGSFVYIIADNRKIRKAQEEQENRQISHEEKQQEMWSFQSEHFAFEKYQTHKSMFNNMLSEIEMQFSGEVKFHARDNFYERLFPQNDFSNCQTKIDLSQSQECTPGSLRDTLDAYNFLHQSLDAYSTLNPNDYYNHVHSHLHKILSLLSLLHVNFTGREELGAVNVELDTHYFILNAFSPLRTSILIENILKRICSFTGNKDAVSPLSHKGGAYLSDAILSFVFDNYELRGFSFETGDKVSALKLLYLTKKAFSRYRGLDRAHVDSEYSKLCMVLTDAKEMKHYLREQSFPFVLEHLGFKCSELIRTYHLKDRELHFLLERYKSLTGKTVF